MTNTRKTMEMAMDALDEVESLLGMVESKSTTDPRYMTFQALQHLKVVRSALAQQGEEQGEPVAWIDPIVGTIRHDYERFDKSGHQPLYAAPQPAVQEETANPARVLEWMRTPNRKPAQFAFTAGPERQAAYWIEIAQGEQAAQEHADALLKINCQEVGK